MSMSIENRAKQFAPFAALKGLPQALAAKEKIIVEKPILSDYALEELDRMFTTIEKGQMVSVTFFQKGQCIRQIGLIAKINTDARILQIVHTQIAFADILKIEIPD